MYRVLSVYRSPLDLDDVEGYHVRELSKELDYEEAIDKARRIGFLSTKGECTMVVDWTDEPVCFFYVEPDPANEGEYRMVEQPGLFGERDG